MFILHFVFFFHSFYFVSLFYFFPSFYFLFFFDPAMGLFAIIFLYLSLRLASAGTFACLVYLLKKKISPDELPGKIIKNSLRQGIFLASVLMIALCLAHKGMLRWWNGSFLIIIALILETFFHLGKRPSTPAWRLAQNKQVVNKLPQDDNLVE